VEHIARRADNGALPPSLFSWVSRAELSVYTHHQLLRDTDVMSMAHSLEVRVPLLDHRLVEAALRLPAELKDRGDRAKPLLVDAAGDHLPDVVRCRQDKRGFTFPFEVWMRTRLREQVEATLSHPVSGPVLRRNAVSGMWQAFQDRQVHWSRAWSLVALHGWMAAQSA
jgi:asparagine synthase (glutamine-hydrolysing)